MAKKVEKDLNIVVLEAKTFHDIIDALVAYETKTLGIYQGLFKQRTKVHLSNRSDYLSSIKSAETELKQLEVRRLRFDKYQSDKKIPAALRKQIAKLETELLRIEHGPFWERFRAKIRKKELAALFEKVEAFRNPPKPLSTTNKAFGVAKAFPGASLTRAYDGYVWEVLRGHFQLLPKVKGQRSSFKVVAALPEKDEYLQLKERHFTKTLAALVDEAYEVLGDLREELQDAYDNMPEGLQGGTVGEARLEAVSQLEEIADESPALPDSASTILLVHYPSLRQSSRADRADEAASKLKAASQEIQKYINSGIKLKKSDVADLEDCRLQLEYQADEIEGIEFPGMFG